MFGVNKEGRNFIQNNFITIRNGFDNEGLIEFEIFSHLNSQFNNYAQLEKLYFKVI